MNYTKPNISQSALITIDTQNDFSLKGAPAEIVGTCEIIPNMVRVLKWYRENHLPIIHIVRIYLSDGSNVDLCRRQRIENGAEIVLPESEGAELVNDLKPEPSKRLDSYLLLKGGVQKWSDNEAVIYKPRWGAFYKTQLERYLAEINVDTLVFCGCNFPNCPRTSIYEASERDFRIILIKDAISGVYQKGEDEMTDIGVELMKTDEFVGN